MRVYIITISIRFFAEDFIDTWLFEMVLNKKVSAMATQAHSDLRLVEKLYVWPLFWDPIFRFLHWYRCKVRTNYFVRFFLKIYSRSTAQRPRSRMGSSIINNFLSISQIGTRFKNDTVKYLSVDREPERESFQV